MDEKKAELLAELKDKMYDKNFSFSFRPLGFLEKISEKFAKETFSKTLQEVAARYNVEAKDLGENLDIDPIIWKKILKGEFYPSAFKISPFAQVGALPICSHTASKDISLSASMIISSWTCATIEQFLNVCMA